MSEIVIVDLFAGGGGFSTGAAQALEDSGHDLGEDVELHAVNHWGPAIETHRMNHPWAEHYHSGIDELYPPDVVDGKPVTLMICGPTCTHFSTARGGRPISEQKREPAWNILNWVQLLEPDHVIVENVPELRKWGPTDDEGQPVLDGSVFEAWIRAFESYGYTVIHDDDGEAGVVLNAADYGDPTSRERLFVMASKDGQPTPPDPTHAEDPCPGDDRTPWRPAAEVIDWSDRGTSLWTRDLENPRVTPLATNTMERIAEGIRRHSDDRLHELADALETIGPDRLRELRETVIPVDEAATVARLVDEPFLVRCPAGNTALTSPSYLLRQQSGGIPASVDVPLPTVSTAAAIGLVTPETRPLIQPRNGRHRGLHSNALYPAGARPLHTVTAKNHDGHLVTPQATYLCPMYNPRPGQDPRTRPIDRPLMTVPASKSPAGLATPYLVDYHGQSDVQPADRPLGALETRERYALCVPEAWPWGLDVRYRMLTPGECKLAQGFPEDYEICGDSKRVVREQIGNAVPVNLGKALVEHVLADETPSLSTYGAGLQRDPDADHPEYEEVVSDD